MASTTTNVQQLIQNLANNLRKNFDEVHRQLTNLNI
jgi:hypothetical protein